MDKKKEVMFGVGLVVFFICVCSYIMVEKWVYDYEDCVQLHKNPSELNFCGDGKCSNQFGENILNCGVDCICELWGKNER